MSSPQRFINRMIVFLVVAAAGRPTYEILFRIYMYNPVLNGLILGVLLIGIVYIFRRVFGLRRSPLDRGVPHQQTGVLPASRAAAARSGRYRARRAGAPRPLRAAGDVGALLLDSISARLDESRDISRYQVGLLIFLGLLGTFWACSTRSARSAR